MIFFDSLGHEKHVIWVHQWLDKLVGEVSSIIQHNSS